MADPWTFVGEIASPDRSYGVVTVVEGSTFCLSGRGGDVHPDSPEGLFFLDTRLLSDWELRVNALRPEPLAVAHDGPQDATFVARVRPHLGDTTTSLLVVRRRFVGQGMREDLSVRNYGARSVPVVLELRIDADFADLFDVKEGRADDGAERARRARGSTLTFRHRREPVDRTVVVSLSSAPTWERDAAVWHVEIPAGGEWSCCAQVSVTVNGDEIPPTYECGEPPRIAPAARRHREWRRAAPQVQSNHGPLQLAASRAVADLGSLRIFDPEHPDRPVIAAGAPWFMTLFGRDALLTAWMALPVDPDLALGVLETLARLQGDEIDPQTEEQPGRILHEVRFGEAMSMKLGDGHIYYGSIDATPLFVILLGELRRWGLEPAAVDRLLPHADRALEWIERWGDRDGDGFVEYQRMTERGLRNQGWKDSWDGVPAADGSLPGTPVSLCEVQGYVYAAYVARAHFAWESSDRATEEHYREKAIALKEAFNRDFWLPDRGWFALGLDGEKRPIDALASNMGHCLWTGIVDQDKAAIVARRLMSDELFSGWGVRTLASTMGSYNPLSYHCGSVWPHDNAVIVAGLMRYGFVEEAHRVLLAMLDAASAHGGRLPELFAGIARDDVPTPVSYPTSCSPQAWAAAAPLLFVRSLLRFDPGVPHGKLWCAPRLPVEIERLTVERVPLAGQRLTIRVERDDFTVEGLDGAIELVSEPRRPLSAEVSEPLQ